MLTYMWASQVKCFKTATAVMSNGQIVFTVSGGPIQILELLTTCVTANDATASTMQWQSVPTVGTATTFSGATASLANLTAGSNILLNTTGLATAPTIITAANGGVQLGVNFGNRIIVKEGTIKFVIGVGSTTGTFYHSIIYRPVTPDSIILG